MKNNIQLTHEDHKTNNIKLPLTLIADDICDPLNIGSLFRLSDALGIEKLYLCGDTAVPPNNRINKTARSTVKHVDYEHKDHAEKLITDLKKSGMYLIALEITSSSLAINSDEFAKNIPGNNPVGLILGAENTGVSESLLLLSDITAHIPMCGNNSSMNIISAASIACFQLGQLCK